MGTLMSSSTGVRLTMKFNFGQLIRFCGWSESVDLGFASLSAAITALPSLTQFLSDRANCLGVGPIMVEAVLAGYVQPATPGARPVRRSVVPLVVPVAPQPGNAYNKAFSILVAGQQYTADFGSTRYFIRLTSDLGTLPVYSRNYWLAGMPDISDETDSAAVVQADALAAIRIYISDLSNTPGRLAGRCNVSIRSVDAAPANLKACTGWNAVGNTYTVPAHGFVVSQPVIAEGFKSAVGGVAPKGRYIVNDIIDANTISLAGAKPLVNPITFGAFRPAVFLFNPVVQAIGQGFTKRDVGRPSGLSVGRRSTSRIGRA
jgi:hypothetical protein